ncbi:MAG: AEC family transporter [Clostridiaceae bacterium]|nr:AEC family transporter [Clostridiaceae bacterium]
MGSSVVSNQVLILFFIMIIGFYAKKKDIINNSTSKKLSELLLKITNPLLVISSFQISFTEEIMHNVTTLFIFSIAAHVFSILLGQILFFKYRGSTKKIMKFSAIYSNCGFMGIPVLESLYGKAGVLFASVYIAVFNIFVWTNGVMIFSDKKKMDKDTFKKALLNPGIISVIIGLFLFIFSIELPNTIASTIELVGSMTTPLSMLIIGSNFADCKLKELFYGFELYYITAVRLVLIPVLTYLVLKCIGLSGTILTVCILMVAMPVAATTTIFAEMYDEDSLFASRVIGFSTLASIITIPFVMLLK